MKALIDPSSPITYVKEWTKFRDKYYPVYAEISNSARVCQVETDEKIFPVAKPLFWEDCPSQTIADTVYFNLDTKQYIEIPNLPPYPDGMQPVSQGTQTI